MSMFIPHRDAFGRVMDVHQTLAGYEHYLRPQDGRLVRLRVQGTDDAYGYGQRSWARIGRPRSRVSLLLKITHWTYSSILVEGTEERRYTFNTVWPLALKWIPSCLLLLVLLVIPTDLEGVFQNGGFYDPIQYRDWRYPKVSRNRWEGEQEASVGDVDAGENQPLLEGGIEMDAIAARGTPASQLNDGNPDEESDDLLVRHFRPRYLCFLRDGPRGPDTAYETWKVTDWIRKHGDYAGTDFVFVSYTRKQFLISAETKWSRGQPAPDEATKAAYRRLAEADRASVLACGMEAARSVAKRAFWVDFECIRDADDTARATAQSDDVYRICDIVRAAHSLVILLGPPHETRLLPPPGQAHQHAYDAASMDRWLQEWGSRLWTLPEILLCSAERRVKLYAVGAAKAPEEIAKRNIAARLIDHYKSSTHLTPLELVSIALECFSWRQTDQFNDGDISSYALMGLLRRRPAVNESDGSFEAFARLSLANDGDGLLERLICMQPTRPDAPWHKVRDAWGVRLWDIEPRCQIAGIVDDRTVTLDGAFGATIQWDAMEQVAFLKRPTSSRLFGKILLRGVPGYLIFALVLAIYGGQSLRNSSDSDPSVFGIAIGIFIPGVLLLIPSALVTLLIPAMLLNIYQGKFWSTQAHFLGLEGIPSDIGEIERLLFGFNHGRLKWSIAGSTLSRNGRSENGERLGLAPRKSDYFDDSAHDGTGVAKHDEETVFTLIDTYAMTATAFRATRPPTTVIVCGHEGGMQRAVLCSYDWRESTFVREAVIRVKTLVLDRMFRVDRFRFALGRRTDNPSRYIQPVGERLNNNDDDNAGTYGSQMERVSGQNHGGMQSYSNTDLSYAAVGDPGHSREPHGNDRYYHYYV